MKKNKKFLDYKSSIEQKQQEKLNKKSKDLPPAKMNRETKRRYIKHYVSQGVPREEIERIIMMQSFDFNNGNNIDMNDIVKKVQNGELPENTLEILQENFRNN